ncbi:MAG: hypothetical protein HDT34_04360 [Clostridiales bacterium]|nr:hypothetical protein [Clostridiales bacterium]
MKKVMFLFGAGVEGEGNYEIASGYEYLKNSLFGNEYKTEITTALKKYFSKEYFGKTYKYSAHSYNNKLTLLQNLVKQKITNSDTFLVEYKDTISILLHDKDFTELKEDEKLKKLIENSDIKHKSNEEKKKSIIEDFNRLIVEDDYIFQDNNDAFLKKLFDVKEDQLLKIDTNVAIGGLLDSYFHTIISPSKYGKNNFSKIFNYYWFCYFVLVEGILRYFKGDKSLSKYYLDEKPNYYDIISDINNFTQKIYSVNISNEGSTYYSLIKDAFGKQKEFEINAIATTNYFRFCEILKDDVIYLNGKLSDFEFPELLEVYDANICTDENTFKNKNIFFPFIFGQSLLKPIINSKQIETFQAFSKELKESEILIIFGFNINEDDNHINSFLHEYVTTGKRLIVVGEEDCNKGENKVKKKLHCEECKDTNIQYCSVKYGKNDEVVGKIMEHLNNK